MQMGKLHTIQKLFANKKVHWKRIKDSDDLESFLQDCKLEWMSDSLLGSISHIFQHICLDDNGEVVMRNYNTKLLFALDESQTGSGSLLYDIDPVFTNNIELYNVTTIRCNGDKCRLSGEEGIWCESCWGPIEESDNLHDLFSDRVSISDIGQESILYKSIDIYDHYLGQDEIKNEIAKLQTQICTKQDLVETITKEIDIAQTLKSKLHEQLLN